MTGRSSLYYFADEADIEVTGGKGGNGIISFLRQRARPKGGPNGGNGGKGGDIIMMACPFVNTLLAFRYQHRIVSGNGGHGLGKNQQGRNGQDTILSVPLGTRVFDRDTGYLHVELINEGQRVILAKGGAGGLGNAHFKSSIQRSPRIATDGKKGENRRFHLELILLAHVGLFGLPNAGKSTFLGAISNAQTKVANYPFTTKTPQLGVVSLNLKDTAIVVADIPGLIKGAANGAGLGNRFLRHLSRTTLLCHILDGTSPSLIEDCQIINEELQRADDDLQLLNKPRWLIINKIDCLSYNQQRSYYDKIRCQFSCFERVLLVSALTQEGLAQATKLMIQRHAQTLN